ncbi:MAG: hypothetical protein FD177_866 [Desulfovibrionaceae bacterium]|nr:MAG: hypothetical protein FD177_866 [Desulfovibrionaceae bacterium]
MGAKRLDAEVLQVIDEWCAQLPPVISRKKLDWFLGGIVSRKHIANLDSAGEGPADRILVGRETVYPTRSVLIWLAETRGLKRLKGIRSLEGMIPFADAPVPQQHP